MYIIIVHPKFLHFVDDASYLLTKFSSLLVHHFAPNGCDAKCAPYSCLAQAELIRITLSRIKDVICWVKLRWKFELTMLLNCSLSYLILVNQGATRSSTFLMSNESSYIPYFNPKISASNSPNFGSYCRKWTHFRYTNFYFFIYFPNSLIPSVTPHERKQKVNLR